MADSTERREAPPRLISTWARAVKSVGHFIAAGALLVAGVVFTMQQKSPTLKPPASGITLAGAMIEAPSFAREAARISGVLSHYTSDKLAADRIAGAIVDESNRRNLDPALLVGVLLTEDATLDTTARSFVGARGLMQVMPTHAGKWGCNSSNLFSIESNICHGASILQDNVKNSSSMRTALLRYNGCVHGSNTPGCHNYPDKVMRAANRTTAQMLALAE
ncbi:MAG: transglycosylase SLT domain-containing protein [Gemmatimonadota bacterium]|nr:transglycosylase SLT domain-containing protein [Gemmatimonadota bacterium]